MNPVPHPDDETIQRETKKPSQNSFSIVRLSAIVALAFLCITVGVTSQHFAIFPATLFQESLTGIDALLEREKRTNLEPSDGKEQTREEMITSARVKSGMWMPARSKDRGVTIHNPERSLQGYTLYCTGEREKALMVNMDGEVVWEWNGPFNEVYVPPTQLGVLEKVRHDVTSWREALLREDGSLITISESAATTPYGLGLACLEPDSQVRWVVNDRYHHDVESLPDGRMAALCQEFATKEKMTRALGEELNYLVDFVDIISEEGVVEKRVSIFDALLTDEWIHLFSSGGMKWWDNLHCNSIARVSSEFAIHHDWAEEGQFIILARNHDLLFQLDWENERVTWASVIPFKRAHDPDLLENGNIMIFDNLGGFPASGPTRIAEYNPTTGECVWAYEGTEDQKLDSFGRGVQQVLENGNILINESAGGRILEVTRDKEIVWEYFNPDRITSADGVEHVAMICNPWRFTEEELPEAILERIRKN